MNEINGDRPTRRRNIFPKAADGLQKMLSVDSSARETMKIPQHDKPKMKKISETIAHSPVCTAVTEDLIDRKKHLFGDDNLLIGEYRVTKLGPGEINTFTKVGAPT